MTKIDYRKEWKHLYAPSTQNPVMVDVPPHHFLMIDGQGNPNNNPVYQEAVSALFQLSYALKFAIKKSQGIDYAVMPLEGLWWAEDMGAFNAYAKDQWLWTMMILQPEYVSENLVGQMRAEVEKKKNPTALSKVRYQTYHEGFSVQLMHIGPYMEEAPNIARMHAYAEQQGYHKAGKHHEIYLSDVNKTSPEKLRTILRQPLAK